jgi:CheY-like chemotaxis protein
MGLDLMQSEVAQALGVDSPTTLRSLYDMVDDEAFEASERSTWSDADIKIGQQADYSSFPSSGETFKMRRVDSSSTLESMPDINISSLLAKSWFQLSQEIQRNAQGAVDILNDLLNYDKIEQGTLNLCLEILPIWELIEKAIMEFKVPASSKKVGLNMLFGLETRTAPRARYLPPYIRNLKVAGDPVRLLQVVRNLMSNALKFTPAEGSIRVQAIYLPNSEDTVEEHFELRDGQIVTGYNRGSLRVRVIDSGAGMSKDQVDDLFQEGVQFNANELQAGGGSGLGLYIAKGIVSQHSGNLSASSEGLDHGTTFEMALPLLEITSSNDSDTGYDVEAGMPVEDHGSVTNTNHSLRLPKSKLKVLVVDDVKSNRKLLRRILENKGHECDEAVDGQECVDMVRKAGEEEMPYDSILLDYEMPGMDGPTAAKEIRCTLLDYETNIVGVTGNVLPEDVNFFKNCGANDVLSKPVKLVDVCTSWETHCILLTNNNSREELHHA